MGMSMDRPGTPAQSERCVLVSALRRDGQGLDHVLYPPGDFVRAPVLTRTAPARCVQTVHFIRARDPERRLVAFRERRLARTAASTSWAGWVGSFTASFTIR